MMLDELIIMMVEIIIGSFLITFFSGMCMGLFFNGDRFKDAVADGVGFAVFAVMFVTIISVVLVLLVGLDMLIRG